MYVSRKGDEVWPQRAAGRRADRAQGAAAAPRDTPAVVAACLGGHGVAAPPV